MKTKFEKDRDKNIKKIKKAITELKKLGYRIEEQLTETLLGTVITHIYIRNRLDNGYICEQKHLFSLDN